MPNPGNIFLLLAWMLISFEYLQASNLLHGSLVGVLGLGRRRVDFEEDITIVYPPSLHESSKVNSRSAHVQME